METVVEEIRIGRLRLLVERPSEPESLLDEDAFADDEFLPYWAELWPSGVALATRIAGLELRRRRVLELGCGLGLPSLVAAMAGAEVVATDWAPDALALLRRNAERNGATLTARPLDWRCPEQLDGARFDLVLAADVLYEERNAAPLLALLRHVVADNGEALVADPGRLHARSFPTIALTTGWSVETEPHGLLRSGGIHRLRRG